MFEVITLGSGSAGNATLVRSRTTAFLVDAGLSARQLARRLAECALEPHQLAGVVLTHEHSDHTGALRVLLSRHELPVFCNPLTAHALKDGGLTHGDWRLFQTGSEFAVGDFAVRSFAVPHDASDPVGFRITCGEASFGVLTDLGHATSAVFEMLRGIRALLIETNYDEALLQRDTRRPWSVKQRILSRHGHLSNSAAASVVRQLEAPLTEIILGHLSRDCNSPELAIAAMQTAVGQRPCRVHCAGQHEKGPPLAII